MSEVVHSAVAAWWVPAIIAAAILYWAFKSFSKFQGKIEPLKTAVRSATEGLVAIPSERAFAEAYEPLDGKLRGDAILGATWEEFSSTLILPSSAGVVKNTRRPSEYFNDGLYYKGGIDLRSFESVPNQLVGVGLFFTFIGLVASLLIAKQGIGADIETAKAALGDLLNAAAFKFVTSIAALGGSVVYLARKNTLLHEADELVEQFCRELERLMVQVTSESLAEDARRELISQTAELERFNTELAVAIAEALDGRLRESLGLAMQPVASEIGNLANRLGQINQDALEQMVGRFSSELSGAAREHTDQMARMLQSAAESIAAVPGHIDEAGVRFSDKIRQGADELATSMTAAAENMDATLQTSTRALADSVGASAATFSEIAAEIEGSHTRQKAFAEELSAAQDEVSTRLRTILDAGQEAASQLSTLAEQVTAAAAAAGGLGGLAHRLEESASVLSNATGQVSALVQHVEALNNNAGRTVQTLAERVTTIEREIASMNNALSTAFERVATGVGQFGDKTTGFVKDLDKTLADAIGRLSGAVQQFDEVLGEMPKKGDFQQLTRALGAARAAEPAQ